MQFKTAAATRLPQTAIPWRRMIVILVFVLTLGMTVKVAGALMGVFSPPVTESAAELNTILTEINKVSSPVGADLSTYGFAPEGQQASAAPAITGAQPITSPAKAAVSPSVAAASAGMTTTTATVAPTQTATPILPAWDRKGRVNILLMGLDGNASQGRYRRADSLIVASIDPATNTAVLIGIPRDTYVTINSPKGALRNKINTAYVWGELYNYPGGGPALQMRTVSELLGIPIHHYVSVYFDGFAKLVDAIGGVDINVQTAIRDNYTGWSFNAGMQHMDGKKALQFARSRYSTSDFSRGRRQQQVILAAVEKMTKAGILAKLPAVLPTVSQAFRSDMSIPDLLSLASLGYKIDRSNIKTAQVDETMVTSYRAPDGASALLPKIDRVRAMVQAAIAPPAATVTATLATTTTGGATAAAGQTATTAPPTATTQTGGYRSEKATIEVLNGTNTIGLARRTQTWLQGQELNVVRIADASGLYKQTVLYHDGSKPQTRDMLISLLGIKAENVRSLAAGGVNIRLVVGADAKVP